MRAHDDADQKESDDQSIDTNAQYFWLHLNIENSGVGDFGGKLFFTLSMAASSGFAYWTYQKTESQGYQLVPGWGKNSTKAIRTLAQVLDRPEPPKMFTIPEGKGDQNSNAKIDPNMERKHQLKVFTSSSSLDIREIESPHSTASDRDISPFPYSPSQSSVGDNSPLATSASPASHRPIDDKSSPNFAPEEKTLSPINRSNSALSPYNRLTPSPLAISPLNLGSGVTRAKNQQSKPKQLSLSAISQSALRDSPVYINSPPKQLKPHQVYQKGAEVEIFNKLSNVLLLPESESHRKEMEMKARSSLYKAKRLNKPLLQRPSDSADCKFVVVINSEKKPEFRVSSKFYHSLIATGHKVIAAGQLIADAAGNFISGVSHSGAANPSDSKITSLDEKITFREASPPKTSHPPLPPELDKQIKESWFNALCESGFPPGIPLKWKPGTNYWLSRTNINDPLIDCTIMVEPHHTSMILSLFITKIGHELGKTQGMSPEHQIVYNNWKNELKSKIEAIQNKLTPLIKSLPQKKSEDMEFIAKEFTALQDELKQLLQLNYHFIQTLPPKILNKLSEKILLESYMIAYPMEQELKANLEEVKPNDDTKKQMPAENISSGSEPERTTVPIGTSIIENKTKIPEETLISSPTVTEPTSTFQHRPQTAKRILSNVYTKLTPDGRLQPIPESAVPQHVLGSITAKSNSVAAEEPKASQTEVKKSQQGRTALPPLSHRKVIETESIQKPPSLSRPSTLAPLTLTKPAAKSPMKKNANSFFKRRRQLDPLVQTKAKKPKAEKSPAEARTTEERKNEPTKKIDKSPWR